MPDAPNARPLDFIAIGRAAVDLYGEQVGARLEEMSSFAKYVGGCAGNIVIGAARLGLKPAMLTRVGDEHMGRFVRETLAAEGVDVSHVKTDPERLTGLVILGIRDRETFPLIFYRENCADMALSPEDFDAAFIASARALVVTGTHFSTESTDKMSRTAIGYARAAGTKVVLDIDYRPVLWGLTGRGDGEVRYVASGRVSTHLKSVVALCDLVVGTEEEFRIAGGAEETLGALRALRAVSSAVFVVKLGAQGCVVFTGAIPTHIEDGVMGAGFPVEVFNVLGAGDGFMAGLLRGWLRGADWPEACRIANACGALVVSRHGCSPAMPSSVELDFFLSCAKSGGAISNLSQDKELARLHRVTTAHRSWPQVCALAFDHRRQFDDLAKKHGADSGRIRRFKHLIAEGLLRAGKGVPGAGALIDERYGRDVLDKLTGTGLWLARPVELPASAPPLEFEYGPDVGSTMRAWPAGHIAKALVYYRPDEPEDIRSEQEKRVAHLRDACAATGRDMLIEIIARNVAPTEAGDLTVRSVANFYAAGLKADWWKLQPSKDPVAWCEICALIRKNDPYCQGVVILGQEIPDAELRAVFAAAAPNDLVRGFAVGRTIFWGAAEAWFGGKADDRAAVDAIADQYQRSIEAWKATRR